MLATDVQLLQQKHLHPGSCFDAFDLVPKQTDDFELWKVNVAELKEDARLVRAN